ncbi:MAG: L-fucokinase [Phycisphaerae bacterium]
MPPLAQNWDYLIVTASNDEQAKGYQVQLDLRRRLGLLAGVAEVLVVADPHGKRVGSGGSTVYCLMEVLQRRLAGEALGQPAAWQEALSGLRILIVHAGGDSKRLPAYGPCGKIFIPVPGDSDAAVGATLLDRQLPIYLSLPAQPGGGGQVVITAGDVLLGFDPSLVRFAREGITGLGCLASPAQASKHGVYCGGPGGSVRLFLQKPSTDEQQQAGAVDRYGQSILDIGVMSFDAATARALLTLCGAKANQGRLGLSGPVASAIERSGMDFYREVCCALGSSASFEQYRSGVRSSGSAWDEATLAAAFEALSPLPFAVQVCPRCRFLHFGTTRQIISSGEDLLREDRGVTQLEAPLNINSLVEPAGSISGSHGWVEACRIKAPLRLEGQNVVVGVDVESELSLPMGVCLDVITGTSHEGKAVWFVRCYGVTDSIKDSVAGGASFCGMPASRWLAAMGAKDDDAWDAAIPADQRTVWNARLFPAEQAADGYRNWLWMFDPLAAGGTQRRQWRQADRYSLAEIAVLTDQAAFYRRRSSLRAAEIQRSLRRMFRLDSGFSSAELAYVLATSPQPAQLAAQVLAEAQWHHDGADGGVEAFAFARIIHTLGAALMSLAGDEGKCLSEILPGLEDQLTPALRTWLEGLGLSPLPSMRAAEWAEAAKAAAFTHMGQSIVSSGARRAETPRSSLRSDEIVWGRAPARLDLGGGWTDTPPYSLEFGGCVINAAVNLNGQPPIQAYARVIDEPVVRIASIDLGLRIEVSQLEDLLNYRTATSGFGLAKAALALSGLAPESAAWPAGITLRGMLERFGGGIELTTLAAIPKGSGLGTSSIMGAVILAVIQRVMGHTLTSSELFHGVLQLEQALTTGGGWQDQIGGAVDGVKIITTEAGLIPDARMHYVPSDVLDPRANGGCSLLYYTGITRLAKNILQQVVGRYLDRDRAAMATLRRLHTLPPLVAEAMARKDIESFGGLIDQAWRLNKELDRDSSNAQIEALLASVQPHLLGAKLLGAGGGGFLLMVCKSPAQAQAVRQKLSDSPPNERGRFFDFDISREGLVVTIC